MAKNKHLRNLSITVLWPNLNHEELAKDRVTAVPRWIDAGGGTYSANKLTDSTTHLVCSEEMYKEPHDLVKEALSRNAAIREKTAEGERPEGLIKLVGPEWLHDSLHARKRMAEGLYMWSKILATKPGKSSEATTSRSVPSLLTSAFFEATDEFLDPETGKKLAIDQQQKEKLEEARRLEEAIQERVRKEMKRKLEDDKRRANALKRRGGIAKAGEEYWAKWGVYVGDGGVKNGKVARWSAKLMKGSVEKGEAVLVVELQIHESKFGEGVAKQYSTNMHFEGTALRKRNNIMACSGTSLATAKRFFEAAFLELTGVSWANRNKGPDERRSSEVVKLERRAFRFQPGSEGQVPGASAAGAIELDDGGDESNVQGPIGPTSPSMDEGPPMSMVEQSGSASEGAPNGDLVNTAGVAGPADGACNVEFGTDVTIPGPGSALKPGDFSAHTTLEQLAATAPDFNASLTQDKNYDWSSGMNFETQPTVDFYDPNHTFTPEDPFDFDFGDPSFAQYSGSFIDDAQMHGEGAEVDGLTGFTGGEEAARSKGGVTS